ncbi:MAG: nuclear transport factor 2 family protein [Devosia sp.]|nr:nuclear transport factor 2 family protein [Devosia sp.]
MTNRRDTLAGLLAGASVLMMASGAAAKEASKDEALKALDPWADALFSGDPKKVAAILADEYQIVRSDGTGYDKAAYLQNLPKQSKRSTLSDIHATQAGAIMVVRYQVDSDQVINGKNTTGLSPRLSVFRAEGNGWLMVSHANFAQLA